MDGNMQLAPERVELIYRVVGKTHVFSSRGIRGLVHAGSHDREKAFNDVINVLCEHVNQAYGIQAHYKSSMTYSEFSHHIDTNGDLTGNFIIMTRESQETGCSH